jgi:hypothetical protein
MKNRDTLEPKEPHPSAYDAMRFVLSHSLPELMVWQEAFASSAIEGNRLAEVCLGTLTRVLNKEPVSDRYILGLAWAMKGETK